jgi:hypothetical protein
VGLRATSESAEISVTGVPYLALAAGLAGPTTTGVNELAVEVDLVVAVSLGLVIPDDLTGRNLAEGTALVGLVISNDDASVTMEDCSLEALNGVWGSGL